MRGGALPDPCAPGNPTGQRGRGHGDCAHPAVGKRRRTYFAGGGSRSTKVKVTSRSSPTIRPARFAASFAFTVRAPPAGSLKRDRVGLRVDRGDGLTGAWHGVAGVAAPSGKPVGSAMRPSSNFRREPEHRGFPRTSLRPARGKATDPESLSLPAGRPGSSSRCPVKESPPWSRSTLWRLRLVAACLTSLAVGSQEVPPPSQATPDPWPKSATQSGTQYTIFQPQLDRWDDYHYEAHAAVQVIPAGTKSPVFGVIEITATTIVDRPNRVVHIENLKITEAKFPSATAAGRRSGAPRCSRSPRAAPRRCHSGGWSRRSGSRARSGSRSASRWRTHLRRSSSRKAPRCWC